MEVLFNLLTSDTLFKWLPIVHPFHLQGWVRDRNDPALKVGPLALLDLHRFEGRGEDWSLGGDFLFKLSSASSLLLLQVCKLARLR